MDKQYYQTKESVEEYIQLAKDVDGAELIARLQEFLPTGSSLLEIGSGPGSDWKLLHAHYQVMGSDFSTEFLQHLRQENPHGQFLALDAVTLDTDQRFDGIYSNKVLHHLTEEALASSIQRQYDLLHPNGIICHSLWKGTGDEIFKGLYVKYHTEESLQKFYSDHFEILLIDAYQEFEAGDSLLLIARKKV